MKRTNVILMTGLLMSFFLLAFGGTDSKNNTLHWNGYIQFRYSNDYYQLNGFNVRRAKLISTGTVPFYRNLSYKVQTQFQSTTGNLVLQDVYVEYRTNTFKFRIGQMIPFFSLQRFQPDAVIPLMERARAVDNLIPSAETGARDIGISVLYKTKTLESAWGVFNGNGGNHKSNEDRNLLFTSRNALFVHGKELTGLVMLSLAYRKTDGLQFNKLLPTGYMFSGNDFRWGVSAKITYHVISIQGEYLEAHLENRMAWGYYGLITWSINKKNDLTVFYEKFHDLKAGESEFPWYSVNYSYYLQENKLKLMLEEKYQPQPGRDENLTLLQLQVYFH